MAEAKKEILGVYEELKGVLASMPEDRTWFDDKGFTEHANRIITRAASICPEISDIESYKVVSDHQPSRGPIVYTIQTKSRLNALIGRLKGTYDLDTSPTGSNGNTFIQNQSQTQSQYINLVLDLQEKIIAEIPKHAEGTKERSFLEKLKVALSTTQNVMDILASVLRIGGEFGLDPSTIHKLLL